MSTTTVQAKEQRVANLATLYRELAELANKTKHGDTKAEQPRRAQGLVFRGK
jgi:hypothetical protein